MVFGPPPISVKIFGSMAKSSSTSSRTETPLKSTYRLSSDDLWLEQQAVRKLDYTILPVMAMLHLLSFLDRTNIGNARVAGLQKHLHLIDSQYQICVSVLYVPYIAAELPSNLLLRRIGPRLLMSTLLTCWGIIVTLQGFVTSYAGLLSVRVFLGLFEGPMFPGIVLYLSSFYTRKELALRIALFYSTSSLSTAFSGLLAAAIETMDGVGGRPGWAWIFILEGLFSVVFGLISFFIIPSTPHDSRFLTEAQKNIIMRRLEYDRPTMRRVDRFSLMEVVRSITSPHVVIIFIMFFMTGTTLYGLTLFLPSIVNQLGFSPNKSQLMSVGPFVAAFFLNIACAFWSDRYQARGITTVLISVLAAVGFAVYLSAENKYMSYGALYLMVPGVYGTFPVLATWMANNSEPHYRRATSIALSFIASNAGGILSIWSYPDRDGPKFRKTTTINLVFLSSSILVIMGSLANMAYLSWRNKIKKRPTEREKLLKNYVAANKEGDNRGLSVCSWMELGDRHPDFVYTL